MNLTWRNPSTHHWNAVKKPGLSLHYRSSRLFRRPWRALGHLHGMTFVHGVKSLSIPAPVHLLDFWGIFLGQLFEDQVLEGGSYLSCRRSDRSIRVTKVKTCGRHCFRRIGASSPKDPPCKSTGPH
ncbi:uncharacterized protein TNCV_3604501 [Trichonephila clavipes]|nr:uncharacterized protein TNCV_3604501 [Trichonephila clavipes]